MRNIKFRVLQWLAVATTGTAFFMNGCDSTLQTTVENGIITLSQSLLTVIFRALIALGEEKNSASAMNFISDLGSRFA